MTLSDAERHEVGRIRDLDGKDLGGRRILGWEKECQRRLVVRNRHLVIPGRIESLLGVVHLENGEILGLREGLDVLFCKVLQLVRGELAVTVFVEALRDKGGVALVEAPAMTDPGELAARREYHVGSCRHPDMRVGEGWGREHH